MIHSDTLDLYFLVFRKLLQHYRNLQTPFNYHDRYFVGVRFLVNDVHSVTSSQYFPPRLYSFYDRDGRLRSV